MPNSLRNLLVLMLAGYASAALAQTIDKPAPDIIYEEEKNKVQDDEKWELKKQRGRMVLTYFWRLGNIASIEGLKEMRKLEAKYRMQGVRFIGFCASSKEQYEKDREGHDFEVPDGGNFYGTVVKYIQPMYGALSEPYVVIIDWRGILRWRGVLDDEVEDRLQEMLKLYPPPGGDREWQDRQLRRADKLLDGGEIGKAFTIAKAVQLYTDDGSEFNAKAEAMMEKLEGAAGEWLKEAIRDEQAQEYDKAARIVAEISARMEDTDVARDAELEIGRMNGRRELKTKIRDAIDNAKGEIKFDEAQMLAEGSDYEGAKALYEQIVEEHEDAKIAEAAKAELEKIAKDPEIRKVLDETRKARLARRWMDIAQREAAQELYSEARQWYQKVIDEYPGSDEAKRAERALGKLPAEKKDD